MNALNTALEVNVLCSYLLNDRLRQKKLGMFDIVYAHIVLLRRKTITATVRSEAFGSNSWAKAASNDNAFSNSSVFDHLHSIAVPPTTTNMLSS